MNHSIADLQDYSAQHTCVAELGKSSMEKPVLLPKGLVIGIRMALLSLELHICVCDFWDGREVEHDGKDEDKNGNGKVDPLHIL